MRKRIAILGSLILAFFSVAAMTSPTAGPGCDCNAHGTSHVPSTR